MNLIDKDALIKEFSEECVGECACCKHDIEGECYLLKNAHVIADVVRCEECEYGEEDIYPDPNGGLLYFCKKRRINRTAKYFCASGKRKVEHV